MKRGMKLFIIFIFLVIIISIFESSFVSSISLSESSTNYTIQNEFYKAVITKASPCGIIRYFYVNNSNNLYSIDLLRKNLNYGLGYLEGTGTSNVSRAFGLQNANCSINIIENTSRKVVLLSNASYNGSNFTEKWTFWDKKPYFQSDASVIVTDSSGFLTNQFQYAWMVNGTTPSYWFGSDENGNIYNFSKPALQYINSPNLTMTYPWTNWQFTSENVSLGLVFTNVYDYFGTLGQVGDWNYEYQLDFELGTGFFGSPVKTDYKRDVTTVYYVSKGADNNISNFSRAIYQGALTSLVSNPVIQDAQWQNNSIFQNNGTSSALVNSPYFIVRQNSQNMQDQIRYPQYQTSIYAPLYKKYKTIHTQTNDVSSNVIVYDFEDPLTFFIRYNNGSTIFNYGNITQESTTNQLNQSTLEMNATSTDNTIFYHSVFIAYNDSDKLEITGNVSNASSSASIKEIYLSLDVPMYNQTKKYIAAENTSQQSSIINTTIAADNLWTLYPFYAYTYSFNYGYYYGTTGSNLIYRDNTETVPALPLNLLNVPDGEYAVTALVMERTAGNITYRYSLDNQTFYNFTVANSSVDDEINVSLGLMNITNHTFYIDDDDNASGGVATYVGWDGIALLKPTKNLGNNTYDIPVIDDIYGKIGIGVKVNYPTTNITIVNNTNLQIYLYYNETNQTLTNFSYPFDIIIYPHMGWLNNSSDFTALHSINILNYTKHFFYPAEGIHTGRINSVYSSGAITYSSEPYNNSSLVNMSLTTDSDFLNVSIGIWRTSGDYYKEWIENSSVSTANTTHVIGDLSPNTYYNVLIDGTVWNTLSSNSSGWINFVYNGGYSTKTFEIQQTSALSAASLESDSDYPLFKPTPQQLTSENGYEVSLFKNWQVRFNINNETHTIKLDNIINNTATITVSSTPVTFNLTLNETKKLNLENDSYYDLSIFLKNLSNYNADLIIKSIHEQIPAEQTGETSGTVANEESFIQTPYFYAGAVIITAIIIIISSLLVGKKNKKR